jgi:transposase
VARLDEITCCGVAAAQAVIAEVGLDMTVFGTPGRLVSWARRCPQTRQSGNKTTSGKAGKANPWPGGILGEIAASAARTDTFLGERYRRLARRRGKRKVLTAITRSILVIIFHLLAGRSARYRDLGPYPPICSTVSARFTGGLFSRRRARLAAARRAGRSAGTGW